MWTSGNTESFGQNFEAATTVWPAVLMMRQGEGRSRPAACESTFVRWPWRLGGNAERGLLRCQNTTPVTPVELDKGRQRFPSYAKRNKWD